MPRPLPQGSGGFYNTTPTPLCILTKGARASELGIALDRSAGTTPAICANEAGTAERERETNKRARGRREAASALARQIGGSGLGPSQ